MAKRVTLLALVSMMVPAASRAADTTETWDRGAFDVELFLGYDGLGRRSAADHMASIEFVLGYGILPELAIYTTLGIEADGALSMPLGGVALGLYGTPLDTRHVDLDLFLEVGIGGPGFREWSLTPSLELNVDAHPERLTWGFFVRAGLPMHGRPDGAGGPSAASLDVEGLLGAYWRPHRDHELVLEFDTRFHPVHGADHDRRAEVGGLALGYNVMILDGVEFLTQVSADVPQGAEPWSVGFTAGFILTLPEADLGSVASR